MTTENETQEQPAKVVARFKSSSQKGGAEGYELMVTDEARDTDVIETIRRAKLGRELMRRALDGTDDVVLNVHRVLSPEEMAEGQWERDQMRDPRA